MYFFIWCMSGFLKLLMIQISPILRCLFQRSMEWCQLTLSLKKPNHSRLHQIDQDKIMISYFHISQMHFSCDKLNQSVHLVNETLEDNGVPRLQWAGAQAELAVPWGWATLHKDLCQPLLQEQVPWGPPWHTEPALTATGPLEKKEPSRS